MNDTLLAIAVVIVFIVGPFWLIRRMEKRAVQKGSLFTGKPTRGMRILAIVLGVLFAGIFILEILNSSAIHIWFPILALALLGYGLGAGQLLSRFQNQEENVSVYGESSEGDQFKERMIRYSTPNSLRKKIFSIVKRWAMILGVSALIMYGAFWAMIHPNDPLTLWFVLGVVVLLMFATIGHWLRWFSKPQNVISKPADVNLNSKPRELSDPIYLELRTIFREKLFPLKFEEVETPGLGIHLKYMRGQSKLYLGIDIREQRYYFDTNNPDFKVSQRFSEGDQFKIKVLDKFEEWLAKQ